MQEIGSADVKMTIVEKSPLRNAAKVTSDILILTDNMCSITLFLTNLFIELADRYGETKHMITNNIIITNE